MKESDYQLLQHLVFSGITTEEIKAMLTCLSAREATFRKDEIIFSYGKQLTSIGIVLDGCVHILKEDFWGNANLMSECQPGDIFGEAYAINASAPLEMNISRQQTAGFSFWKSTKYSPCAPLHANSTTGSSRTC